jgi:hypothetical protein
MSTPPTADRRRPPRGGWLLRLRAGRAVVAGGLFCFVAGFLVAPCLHNYAHRPDHTHDGAAVHGEAARVWLYHQAHFHRHRTTADATADDREPGTGAPVPVGHGHHSPAHFGLAIPAALLFVLTPPFRPSAPLAPPARPTTIAAEAPGGLPAARGPPGA